MSSKIDHKELQRRLKEDEFQVYLQEARQGLRRIADEYGRTIGVGILIVVIASVGFYFWNQKTRGDFEASQLLFSNAIGYMQLADAQYGQAITELNELIRNYPDAQVTKLGYVLRGNAHFSLGAFQQALQDYQQVIDRLGPAEEIPTRIAMAQAYRSLEQPQAALQQLELLEARVSAKEIREQILYLKGGCYYEMDDAERASEAFKSIPPDSSWYSFAQEQLLWLEAEAAPPINP